MRCVFWAASVPLVARALSNTCKPDDVEISLGLLKWGSDQHDSGRFAYTQTLSAAAAGGSEVVLTAQPPTIAQGRVAKVHWENAGTYTPLKNDWIGHYCGSDLSTVADTAYVDWQSVSVDGNWASGAGTESVTVKAEPGLTCEFRMFNHEDGTSYHKIGTSNSIKVSKDAPIDDEVSLSVSPANVMSGDSVTLVWADKGTYSPLSNDWIGYYCGDDLSQVADTSYLDWQYVTVDAGWANGTGRETLPIESARKPRCEFRMFNHEDGSSYYKIGTSNAIEIADAGTIPHHLHLALTGDETEMMIQWTAGTAAGVVQYVLASESWDSSAVQSTADVECHTYTASEMCHAPATSTSNFVDPGQLCKAVMTGLIPDAQYKYRVGVKGETFKEAHFQAAPKVNPEYSFSYLVYGDMGTHRGGASSETTASICTEEIAKGARMTHHFGDLSYAKGLANIWDVWMPMIEPYASVAPYMVSIGNHEFDYSSGGEHDPSGEEQFVPSWGNFFNENSGGECGVPTVKRFNMPAQRSGGNGLFWYSFDFGSLHTVVLSSEHNCSDGSAQKTWLANDLAKVDRSQTPWVVVELHRPMYNNEDYSGDYNVAVGFQEEFEDLLMQYEVDLVLAGHYHSYLRSKRIHKDKADENGIYHFTIGSAGANLDGASLRSKDWVDHFEEQYGFGKITIINRTAMHWQYIRNKDNNNHGAVADETWIVKRPTSLVV